MIYHYPLVLNIVDSFEEIKACLDFLSAMLVLLSVIVFFDNEKTRSTTVFVAGIENKSRTIDANMGSNSVCSFQNRRTSLVSSGCVFKTI